MRKGLAIIALSLALLVIFVSGLVFLDQFNVDYSLRIEESKHQDCDIETTVSACADGFCLTIADI